MLNRVLYCKVEVGMQIWGVYLIVSVKQKLKQHIGPFFFLQRFSIIIHWILVIVFD